MQVPSLIPGGKPKSFHTVWPGQSASSHVTLATEMTGIQLKQSKKQKAHQSVPQKRTSQLQQAY